MTGGAKYTKMGGDMSSGGFGAREREEVNHGTNPTGADPCTWLCRGLTAIYNVGALRSAVRAKP